MEPYSSKEMYHNTIYIKKIQSVTPILFLLLFVFFYAGLAIRLEAFDFGDKVQITSERKENRDTDFYGNNTLPIPIYVHFDDVRIENYLPSSPLPYAAVIPPQTSKYPLISFTTIDSEQRTSIQYTYRFSVSDPSRTVKHDDTYRYLFPYAHGEKLLVGQTHNGAYSHSNDLNRYAVDFNAEIGTPVHAARGGLVVSVKEDSNRGGPGATYRNDANNIIIMHDDGSLAYYVHLKQNGSLVEIGDQVTAGQHIGMSGNTGRSTGPHIHFDVHVPTANGLSQSIPVTFISANEEIVAKPEENVFYYSAHPGGRPFEVVLGRYITVDSFDGYIKPTQATGDLDYRTERIDNITVVFCSNGTENDVDVDIDFQFSGLTSDLTYPIAIAIPAESEIFCGLFRPQPNARRTSLAPIIQRRVTVDSFDGYIQPTQATGELEHRTERIDNVIVAFCANGTENDVDVDIDFRFSGLTSDLTYPIATAIPAESEIFCGLFRLQPNATRTSLAPIIQRRVTVDSFDGYIQPTQATGVINFRTERIDSVIVAFCANGTENSVVADITFRLSGLTSDIAYPLSVIIPTKSEIFCGLFRPQKNARRFNIQFSVEDKPISPN